MGLNVRTVLGALALSAAVAVTASGQLIGTVDRRVGNIFPFGGVFPNSVYQNTVYQQVYASSNFVLGPVLISEIDFFPIADSFGRLNTGTFNIFLSTTSAAVDGLNTTDFDANRGADNTLFGSFALGGAAPRTLAFTGPGFFYNPSIGNLLVDMRISITLGGDDVEFGANSGNAGGVYSRATNFGTGFEGVGLQTRFVSTPEPASILLVATGLGGIAAIRWRRR